MQQVPNALASCIILVCRKRSDDASIVSRREFLRELDAVLPEALDEMISWGRVRNNLQSRQWIYLKPLSDRGWLSFPNTKPCLKPMEHQCPCEQHFSLSTGTWPKTILMPTRNSGLHWFEQYGWREGPYGDADTLSRAKGTSVDGVDNAGVIASGEGKVRLHRWSEYPNNWNPHTDSRNPIWETLHHLIRILKQAGETVAGVQLGAVKSQREATRQLAYRLYTLCERKGWAEDARAYNELITSWTGIESAVSAVPVQTRLFE